MDEGLLDKLILDGVADLFQGVFEKYITPENSDDVELLSSFGNFFSRVFDFEDIIIGWENHDYRSAIRFNEESSKAERIEHPEEDLKKIMEQDPIHTKDDDSIYYTQVYKLECCSRTCLCVDFEDFKFYVLIDSLNDEGYKWLEFVVNVNIFNIIFYCAFKCFFAIHQKEKERSEEEEARKKAEKSQSKSEDIAQKIDKINHYKGGFLDLLRKSLDVIKEIQGERAYLKWDNFFNCIKQVLEKILQELFNLGWVIRHMLHKQATELRDDQIKIDTLREIIFRASHSQNQDFSLEWCSELLSKKKWLNERDCTGKLFKHKEKELSYGSVFVVPVFTLAAFTACPQKMPIYVSDLLTLIKKESNVKFCYLFPLWTATHECYRPFVGKLMPNIKTQTEYIDNKWVELIQVTGECLKRNLRIVFKKEKRDNKTNAEDAGDFRGNSVRYQMHLWFFLELITHEIDHPVEDLFFFEDRCRYRGELSYAMRECIRFFLLGERDDYAPNFATYVNSLRVLVEHHVHEVLQLPKEFDLRRYLRELGEVWGLHDANAPLNYLSHVIDVYIGGQFVLASNLDLGAGEFDYQNLPWPISCVLACAASVKPGVEANQAFCQAFGLAALFHDCSHLVCPFEEGAGTSLIWEKRIPQLNLEAVEKTLRLAGSDIASRCIEDLHRGGYFNMDEERDLCHWFQRQKDHGEPDHGLISAWYLHHLCMMEKTKSTDILRSAVRAIMLHNAASVVIDPDRDPLAAILVLVNEALEWNLGRQAGYTRAPGDLIPAMSAVDYHQSQMRYRRISIQGLHISEQKENGKLPICIKAQEDEKPRYWPIIHVDLVDSDHLDVPTFVLWLVKAQAMGRLKPGVKRGGRHPMLVLRSGKPSERLLRGFGSMDLLKLLAQYSGLPVRPALLHWIENLNGFGTFSSGKEEIRLCFENRPHFHEDIRRWVPRLAREAAELLRGIDDHHTAHLLPTHHSDKTGPEQN